MGCNCKTKKKVEDIYKDYGVKGRALYSTKDIIGKIFSKVGIMTITLVAIPIITTYVVFAYFFSKTRIIDYRKFLNLGKKIYGKV